MDSYVELYKGGIIPLKEYAKMPYDRDILVRLIVKKAKGSVRLPVCPQQPDRLSGTDLRGGKDGGRIPGFFHRGETWKGSTFLNLQTRIFKPQMWQKHGRKCGEMCKRTGRDRLQHERKRGVPETPGGSSGKESCL